MKLCSQNRKPEKYKQTEAMFYRRSYKCVYLKSIAIFVVVLFVLSVKPGFLRVPSENHHPHRFIKSFPITTTVNITPKVITIFQTINYKDKYCVLYYLWDYDSEFATMKNAVTLVLHASPTHLKHLEAQIRSWTGPISVAVFVPTPEDTQIRKSGIRVKAIFSAIRKLEKRLLAIQNDRSQIALHVFFEKKGTSECPTLNISRNFDLEFPVELDEMEHFTLPVKLYPINAGRNIAREGVMSDLFISGDAEQVYSDGFEKVMSMIGAELIIKQKRKVALVHRRFEVADNVELPRNKAELKKLLANDSAVPFHKFVYPIGHEIRYLDDWLACPDDIYNAVIVPYNNTLWEPQFVAANNIETPFHDERFPYRFKSNTHLAVLLCYHDFTFAVVDNIFSVHRGIKYNQTLENEFLYTYGKRNGLHQIFNIFNNELNETYPASKVDQCGTLWFDVPQNVTLKSNCTS
uniref:Beta-1,4-glucuronyltransferase 1 n=1 Tax=Panagrellus redivivus TaxID=6233 RepID=A0A7E4ZST0_PANRE